METLTQNPESSPAQEGPITPDLAAQLEQIKAGCFGKELDLAGIDDPWAEAELEFVSGSVEALSQQTLEKIDQAVGSGSGWYEQKFTGERFHLQFYDDPDQAKTAFITNSIYRRLGILAPTTQLVEIDGRLGLASSEIEGAEAVAVQHQRLSPDVRGGIVADAYLANTNVIGTCYDNIVAGVDGFYRASSDGGLNFDQKGRAKDFDPNQIPELKTMLDTRFTSGQIFSQTFDSEIANQARHLLDRLDPAAIEAIVTESGLTGPRAATVRQGLTGRRQFLADRFGSNPDPEQRPTRDCRLGRTVDSLDSKETKQLAETGERLRATESFLSDGDRIEAQTVSLVDSRADRQCLELHFKLTAPYQEETIAKIMSQNHDQLRLGSIFYQSAGKDRSLTHICDAIELQQGDLSIKIAIDPQTKEEVAADYDPDHFPPSIPLSAKGLVSIEIPCLPTDSARKNQAIAQELGLGFSPNEPDFGGLEDQVNQVLVDLLDIPGGLTEPNPEAEQQHKRQRWAWHHQADPDQLSPEQIAAADSLKRLEVAPNCLGLAEPGKHREYQKKYGPYVFFHKLADADSLIPILAAGGLMSSHRRYQLGLQFEGMSTMEDFTTGGADSVFTRLVTGNSQPDPKVEHGGQFHHALESFLVLNPSLADRIDYYAYPEDKFGSTKPEDLKERQRPDEIFSQQLDRGYRPDNEQMFAGGISSQMFEKLVLAQQPQHRWQLTEALMAKILPNPKERLAAFDQGPQAVQVRLEEAFGLADPVNSLWEAGPQAVSQFMAEQGIDEVGHVSLRPYGMVSHDELPVDEWLQINRRMRLIKMLEDTGIEQINGQPIGQFITEADNHHDFVDLANGQPPRSKPDWPNSYQKIPELYGQTQNRDETI